MLLKEICTLVSGRVASGEECLENNVTRAFASDLMSDVLTLKEGGFLLMTGLANLQALRTAEMSDVSCVLLCRNKRAGEDMIELARESDIVIIESPYSMFKCAGMLYGAGMEPVY